MSHGWRAGLLALLLLCSSAALSHAEDEPPPPEAASGTPDTAPAYGTVAPDVPRTKVRLTLREAIESGIEKGLQIQIQRFNPLVADEALRAAIGAYDPRAGGELGYSSFENPTANVLIIGNILERKTEGEAGISGLLPLLGTSYQVQYGGARLLTTSTLATLSPELRSSAVGTVSQPLLKNLIWSEPWTRVKTTGMQASIAREGFRQALFETVRTIELFYWRLIGLADAQRVAEKSVATANALLDQVKTQYDVGVVSKVEVTESEAGLAQREFQLIRARNDYLKAQDDLASLIFGAEFAAGWRFEIEPADDPGEAKQVAVDPELAARKAFQLRPELAIARMTVEQREIEKKFAFNQRLPQFDIVGGYGFGGLSGSNNPDCVNFRDPTQPCSVLNNRNYWASSDDFFGANGNLQWSAKGVFSVPFPNTTAKANLSRSDLELRRASTEAKQEEQKVILEVRDAIRSLRSSFEGAQAAERARVAAEEQLRAERIRLEQGESTPFEVLQREEDLVSAENEKILALYRYREASTNLDRAQGTILDSHRIVVEDASALR
jgi:outer membrane protein TolC